jgi:hypothetical protein
MGGDRAAAAEQATWRASGRRSTGVEWHILGAEIGRAGLRQMYFLARNGTLSEVDTNGKIVKLDLQAETVAFPMVSANHVHVATAKEFLTLTLDLQDVASVPVSQRTLCPGLSSSAIGPDGSIYFATGSRLFAWMTPRRPPPVNF